MVDTAAIVEIRNKNKLIQEKFAATLKAGADYRAAMREHGVIKGGNMEFMCCYPLFDEAAARMAKGMGERPAFATVGLSVDTAKAIASRHSSLALVMRKARYEAETYRLDNPDMFKKPGRPSTYTPVKGQLVIAALREGLATSDAAKKAGVSLSALAGWRRAFPEFNAAMGQALDKRGKVYTKRMPMPPHRRDSYDTLTARMIVEGVAKGRSIVDICKAVDMPSHATVYNWMKRHPDFASAVEKAKGERNA